MKNAGTNSRVQTHAPGGIVFARRPPEMDGRKSGSKSVLRLLRRRLEQHRRRARPRTSLAIVVVEQTEGHAVARVLPQLAERTRLGLMHKPAMTTQLAVRLNFGRFKL